MKFLRFLAVLTIALSSFFLTSCDLPQVSAEERIFLNLSLDYLGEFELPKMTFEGTAVGGLSGIAYDRVRDRFYAVSDDRSDQSPARFYTLKMTLEGDRIGNVEVEKVTTLTGQDGQPYPRNAIDTEGIAISPRQTVFISSEGVARDGIAPFVDEFDLETGAWKSRLPVPDRFVPKTVDDQPSGIRDNQGFEALTLNPGGFNPNSTGYLEPFRVFTMNESALEQDLDLAAPEAATKQIPVRFLHYLVGEDLPTLLAEHLYLIDPAPTGVTFNGVTELLTLDQAGHFLSLERTFGPGVGFNARIYQIATGGATDTSGVRSFKGDLTGIQSIFKSQLLNLGELAISLDNLEGMTLGPQLPDRSQSLVLVSDDNFSDGQKTQFLLFRLRQGR